MNPWNLGREGFPKHGMTSGISVAFRSDLRDRLFKPYTVTLTFRPQLPPCTTNNRAALGLSNSSSRRSAAPFMLSCLSTPTLDSFLRIGLTASRQPRLRHLHSSTPRSIHDSAMSHNMEADAHSRRPKKLICT